MASARLTGMGAFCATLLGCASAVAAQPPRAYHDMFAAWSPDGRRIAFTSDRSGDPEIYVADADGRRLTRLTHAPGRDAHPSWSPDGRSLLFQSPREGGDVRIFAMGSDGRNQRSLAATSGFCGVPAESPDGGRIAFQCSASRDRFGTPEAPWRLFVLERGEARPRPVSRGPGNDQVPTWSPDGRRLLFYSDRSGSDQLHALDLASGAVTQLTRGPASHTAASYSADGRRIAVMRALPGAKGDIYVFTPPADFVRITTTGPEFGMAQFSPDGRRLLLQMPTAAGTRIFVVDSAGGGRPRMIEFRQSILAAPADTLGQYLAAPADLRSGGGPNLIMSRKRAIARKAR